MRLISSRLNWTEQGCFLESRRKGLWLWCFIKAIMRSILIMHSEFQLTVRFCHGSLREKDDPDAEWPKNWNIYWQDTKGMVRSDDEDPNSRTGQSTGEMEDRWDPTQARLCWRIQGMLQITTRNRQKLEGPGAGHRELQPKQSQSHCRVLEAAVRTGNRNRPEQTQEKIKNKTEIKTDFRFQKR